MRTGIRQAPFFSAFVAFAASTAAPAPAQQWQWQRVPSTAHPPADGRVAMAYDPLRQRTVCVADEPVVVTQSATVRRTTTWEWDGLRWLQRWTPTEPAAGARPPVVAFDATRGRVVLVTGTDEVWAFDGRDWQWLWQQPLAGGSSPMSLTYDSVRNRLVMAHWIHVLEEINGQWVQLAQFPGPTMGTAIAFDPVAGTTLAFGGWSFTGASSTTWRWDGVALTPLSTATTPAGRFEHALAFDPLVNRLVLFGGSSGMPGMLTFQDAYEWDGSNWLAQPNLPTPRIGTAAAAHPGGLLLFGGTLQPPAGVFSHELLRRGAAGNWATVPLPVSGRLAAHDRLRGRTVSVVGSRTLEFDGYSWVDVNVVYPGPEPTALAYHGASARVLAVAATGPVWTFDGAAWAATVNPPPGRSRPGLAEDPVRGVVMLAGGDDAGLPRSDVWEWNGATWLPRPPMPIAGACVAAWAGQQLVTVTPVAGGFLATSTFDGVAWTQLPQATAPTNEHRLAGHPTLGAILLQANYLGSSRVDFAMRLVGNTWQLFGPPLDLRSGGGALVYDSTRGALLAHDSVRQRDHVLTSGPATAIDYGAGCGTPTPPLLSVPVPPQVGAFLPIDVVRASANAPVFVYFDTAAASLLVPGGCTVLLANPVQLGFAIANAGGFVSFPATLPRLPALVGAQVFLQSWVVEGGGPFFGLGSLTPGVRLTLGD